MEEDQSIFERQKEAFQTPKQSAAGSVNEEMNNLSRRIRVLEERYANVERKIQIADQNMLRSSKSLTTDVKAINADITEVKAGMAEVKDRIEMLVRELAQAAKKTDVDVMKKYLSFWEPVNFVSQVQVERIVKDMIDERFRKGSPEEEQ